MPVMLGPDTQRRQLNDILSAEKFSPDEANAARAELERRIAEDHQGRVQEMLAARTQARAENPSAAAVGSVTGPLTAGVSHLANSQYLNWVPKAAGALTAAAGVGPGETFADRMDANTETARVGMDFMKEAHPAASVAGEVGGYFAPGPASAVVGAGMRAGAATVGRVAATMSERGILARAGSQMLANMVTGAGTQAALTAMEGDQGGFEQRLSAAASAAANPVAAGINATLGGISGAFRVAATQEGRRAYETIRRMAPAGSTLSPDIARAGTESGTELGRLLNTIGQIPGGRGRREQYMQQVLWNPLRETLEATLAHVRGQGVTDGNQAELARRGIAAMAGENAAAGGRITRLRRSIEGQAFAAEGQTPVSGFGNQFLQTVRAFVDDQVQTLGGSDLGRAILGPIRRATARISGTADAPARPMDIRAVEGIRQAMGDILSIAHEAPDQVKSADVRLANRIYELARASMGAASRPIDQALQAGQFLHGLDEVVAPFRGLLAQAGDPEKVAMKVMQSMKSDATVRTFLRFGSDVEIRGMRATVLGEALQKLGNESSGGFLLNNAAVRKVFGSSSSPFYGPRFDRLMGTPELRQGLEDIAAAHTVVQRGIGAAGNSATAARSADLIAIGTLANVGNILHAMAENPRFRAVAFMGALGQYGTARLIYSIQNGRLAQKLNDLALGVPTAGNPMAGVLAQKFGVSGAIGGAAQLGSAAIGAGARGVGALIRMGQQTPQPSPEPGGGQ